MIFHFEFDKIDSNNFVWNSNKKNFDKIPIFI